MSHTYWLFLFTGEHRKWSKLKSSPDKTGFVDYKPKVTFIVQALMSSRVHRSVKSNFIYDSGSYPLPDIKKWGCQEKFGQKGDLLTSSSFLVSKIFFRNYSKNIVPIDKESKMKQNQYRKHCLEMNSSVVICISKSSKIRTDNLLTNCKKLNISITTNRKSIKLGMFPHTMTFFHMAVYYSMRISIMADIGKIKTRRIAAKI